MSAPAFMALAGLDPARRTQWWILSGNAALALTGFVLLFRELYRLAANAPVWRALVRLADHCTLVGSIIASAGTVLLAAKLFAPHGWVQTVEWYTGLTITPVPLLLVVGMLWGGTLLVLGSYGLG